VPGTPSKHQFGHYQILSRIGRGGMAEVFRAVDVSGPSPGRTVALKRLSPNLARDPAYVERFAGEADLCRLLDHPNIVRVYEVGVIRDVYFMVMELIDGRDLGQLIKRCRERRVHLPTEFALYIARTLLDALACAHEATAPSGKPLDIVHGDVSASNVFISRVGEIKLGDFGSARRGAAAPADGVEGKPFYLSPEVLEGTLTVHADLWAATVILYEMLTLERPFFGKAPAEVFAAIRARSYVPLRERRPELPRAIEVIVDRGFSGIDERFGSAREYGAELELLFDPNVGTPLGVAAVVRGLFG